MSPFTRVITAIAAVGLLLSLLPSSSAVAEAPRFDTLLAVGAPNEDIGFTANAGAVILFRVGNDGLPNPNTAAVVYQGIEGNFGAAEESDFFGASVVIGDFNGDGRGDAAIGSPGEDIGSIASAGMVNIMFGSPTGVLGGARQHFYQGSPGVPGIDEEGDWFGRELAAFDYNADGFDDLAIAAPREDIGNIANAGAVTILFGSAGGLTTNGALLLFQGAPGVPGAPETNDQFGRSIAGTDNRLVIGVPDEDIGNLTDAGAVNIYDRLATNQIIHQNTPGIGGGAEAGDKFGSDVAAVRDAVIVGASAEDGGNLQNYGVVHLMNIPRTGGAISEVFISQGTPGIGGNPESFDHFGSSLSARADGDLIEIAIGSTYESTSGADVIDAGMVHMISFNPANMTFAEIGFWWQGAFGVPGISEEGDTMGNAVAIANNGTLLVGVDGEDFGPPSFQDPPNNQQPLGGTNGGNVLARSPGGAWSSFNQGIAAVPGNIEAGDGFGFSVAG